jgi:NIMA (never in mitosis gene a)-related kinase 2
MLTTWQIMCRKEINYLRMSQREREQLTAEFNILSSLRHPNIVAYYHRDHLKESQELHLYMEFCGGGDLSKFIKGLVARNQYAEEDFVWSVFSQLITALYRCHYGVDPPEVGKNVMCPVVKVQSERLRLKNQVTILHRDLKPENSKIPHPPPLPPSPLWTYGQGLALTRAQSSSARTIR